MLCYFLLYRVNQSHVYMCPLFFGFPSHLGHHRALSRVPCALQYILISSLFYTQYWYHMYVNPNLPIHLTLPFPCWCPYVCSNHAASTTARDLGDAVCMFRRWQQYHWAPSTSQPQWFLPLSCAQKEVNGKGLMWFPARSCHTYASTWQDSRLVNSILPRTTIHFPAGHFLHF